MWHEYYGRFDCMAVYVGAMALGDDDIACHEGRRIVFVDPGVARRLPLTSSAAQVVPAFLASQAYRGLVAGAMAARRG